MDWRKRWRLANPDKVDAYNRSPRGTALRQAASRAWYRRHREAVKRKLRQRYAQDPKFRAQRKKYAAAWSKAHPEKVREYALKGRAAYNELRRNLTPCQRRKLNAHRRQYWKTYRLDQLATKMLAAAALPTKFISRSARRQRDMPPPGCINPNA